MRQHSITSDFLKWDGLVGFPCITTIVAEESTGPAISSHLVRSPLMHELNEPGIELGPLVEEEILKYLKLQEVGIGRVLVPSCSNSNVGRTLDPTFFQPCVDTQLATFRIFGDKNNLRKLRIQMSQSNTCIIRLQSQCGPCCHRFPWPIRRTSTWSGRKATQGPNLSSSRLRRHHPVGN